MLVTLIIPVFNQWHLLTETLKSLSEQSCENKFELIIIDNGSDDVPEKDEFFDTTIVECNKPGSYAARNFGLKHASGELIIFTDADCSPDREWIEQMISAYEKSNKKTLIAGNVVISTDSKYPSSAELYDIAAGLPQERYVSKGYAVTANLAIPKVVFDKIGLFDDTRFSGGDADFCQRALNAGFELKFVPGAVVYHPARKTWDEYATKVRRMKGGQIRAGKLSRRLKYFSITLVPPVWRIWRTVKSDKLTVREKSRVIWFQIRLWGVELSETMCLLLGKTPERR